MKMLQGTSRQLTIIGALVSQLIAVPAYADGGGNSYFSWTIDGPIPSQGLNEVSFYHTVQYEPHRSAENIYWANQFTFKNGNGGYIGIQPRPSVGGVPQGMALFSLFGAGATTTDPNCRYGADNGAGISCATSYPWKLGRRYQLQVINPSPLKWHGNIIDTVTGASTHIGAWTVPSTWTGLQPSQAAFTELYGYNASCDANPSTVALFGLPTALNGVLQGRYTNPSYSGQCRAYFNNWIDAAGGHSETNYIAAPTYRQLVGFGDKCATAATVAVPANQSSVTLQVCRTNAPEQSWVAASDGTVRTMGKCLNASTARNSTGDFIIDLQACDGGATRHWTWSQGSVSDAQKLKNVATGRCLDASGRFSANGTPLITYPCNQQDNQDWRYQ
jgi:hypothetical protein